MVKYVVTIVALSFFFLGCGLNSEGCLKKEGFNNCEDFKAAMKKAQGKDEVYRFYTIAKKCGCGLEE
jgi:hypothetical protein